MKKGDILTVIEASQDNSGSLVKTDTGHLLGILSAENVDAGMRMQVGPVCGDWCKVFLKGDTYRAQILRRPEDEGEGS